MTSQISMPKTKKIMVSIVTKYIKMYSMNGVEIPAQFSTDNVDLIDTAVQRVMDYYQVY